MGRLARVVALSLCTPAIAIGATIHVPEQQPTIGAALAVAGAGDEIVLACGTYAERSLDLVPGVTLRSESGRPDCVTIDGEHLGRIVSVSGDTNVPTGIHGITFRNGFATDGGAIALFDSDSLVVEQCRFTQNEATSRGGAVWMDPQSEGTFVGCRFDANVARYGGAAHTGNYQNFGRIFTSFSDCAFLSNVAFADGGAVFVGSRGRPTFTRCSFAGNGATTGGCMYIAFEAAPWVFDSVFEDNRADHGGVLNTNSCGADFNDSRFLRNSATISGGAIACYNGALRFLRCEFVENTAGQKGGAFGIDGADGTSTRSPRLTNCTLWRNAAPFGSGLYGKRLAVVDLHSTIVAGGVEGEAYTFEYTSGAPTVTDTILYGNEGGDWVGAIAVLEGFEANVSANPLFCAPATGDLSLCDGSPALPANNPRGLLIGARDLGCPAKGTTVTTNPAGLAIRVDGRPHRSPAVFSWAPGSTHRVATDSTFDFLDGIRYRFASWSDGGAIDHETAPTAPGTIVSAAFDPLYYLTMVTPDSGGTGNPPSGWYPAWNDKWITESPGPDYLPAGWTGTGRGSYTGPVSARSITMLGPITQTPLFKYNGTYHLTMVAQGQGTVTPGDGDYLVGTRVTIQASADSGHSFVEWVGTGNGSYSGTQFVTSILMLGPITQVANFRQNVSHPLTVTATPGGTTSPSSGTYPEGTVVGIAAVSSPGFRFVEWVGSGAGSYSGPDSTVDITMDEPITQHAVFAAVDAGYHFSISASATDPSVNADLPTQGLRNLYLWMTCTDRGLAALEAGVTTTLPVVAFVPQSGVLNIGQNGDLLLAVPGCPTGAEVDFLLGHWVVGDIGGEICLAPSQTNARWGAVDCASTHFLWPIDVVGFSSSGVLPCQIGQTPCGGSLSPATVAAPAAALPAATSLGPVRPNPFSGEVVFDCDLAATSRLRVSIYDVSGRLVRRLSDEVRPPGRYGETWNGRDDGGVPVAAGVYFVTMEAHGRAETRRVVRIRER